MDNSIDEAMAGYCDQIEVIIRQDGAVSIADNGTGIPVDIHPKEKVSALQVVMTKLHAGGKFGGEHYQVSGGLHGVGVSVVNALSLWLEVEVRRGGKVYHQRYERGKPRTEVKVIGETTRTGTKVVFQPDPEIFESCDFDLDTLMHRLRELAFLTRGLRINLQDDRVGLSILSIMKAELFLLWNT